jgi:outer membrane protein TolC
MTWFLLLGLAFADPQPIALRQVIHTALQNNPDLVVERSAKESAASALLSARGAFDPVLGFRFSQKNATTPATSILQGVNGRLDEKTSTQATSLRQRLPWLGISIENQLENNRVSTSNPFTSLNPYYAPAWRTTLAMPLWRNRKTDEARATIHVRRASQQAADKDFEARLLDLASRIEAAYWNWVGARDASAAAQESVRYAREAFASTERLVRAGEQADNELAGARGQLRRAEELAAQAQGQAREAEQQLKALAVSHGADAIWEQDWAPADQGLDLETKSLAELVERARKLRPELAAAERRLAAEKELTKLSAEGRKPAVDLSLSRTAQGLAGRAVPQGSLFPGFSLDAPPQLIGDPGRAYNQVWRNRFPTYEATLSIELPIRNREAEGRFGQQKAQERRAEAQMRQMEVMSTLEVRRAWEACLAAQARIVAAAESDAASRERLESELRLYSEGQSNNLSLNVRQSERSESQQLLVSARRALNLARADLRRAAALTLETFSIQVK